MADFSASTAAALLVAHLQDGTKLEPAMCGPASRADAYRVQDMMIEALGGACGWKVGRGNTETEPYCAPIPICRRLESGGDYGRIDGVARVEAELAFLLRRDVPPDAATMGKSECATLIAAVIPVLELLETRLVGPVASEPLWKLADLQANGGLVVGQPTAWKTQDLGVVKLAVGAGDTGSFETVAHPFGEPFELFCWTVNHVSRHRGGLRQGDVVITGSYCGIREIRHAQRVVAAFADYGTVSLNIL